MKKFFGEFKKFITRGNVLDMSVGVIVGGAFTAIVNGLSNFVLKPIINWVLALILGADGLENVVTYLKRVTLEDGSVDLANSFYIDWGAFINAIINFLLIAIVLFIIVRTINSLKDENLSRKAQIKAKRLERKDMKAKGINVRDEEAVAKYRAEKLEAEEKAKAEAEAKAKAEREANPTTEDLLKQIRDLLQNK